MEEDLRPGAPLVAAIKAIESSRRRIAVVLDASQRLIGTLTDGDVRRCLLTGGSLDTPVEQAMNPHPLSAVDGTPTAKLLEIMRRGNILAVPLVDAQGRFVRLAHRYDIATTTAVQSEAAFEFAVIMAGGEGARLRPITQDIPKPMVPIGGVPLLERQIARLAEAKVRKVFVAVNYLAHIIEEHLGDGHRLGVEVSYIREPAKLGTAGALGLIAQKPSAPILVMNGDILTTSDFGSLYAFHVANDADVTVAAIDHRVSIPYGVLDTEGARVNGVKEKPSQRFLCNAGIYAVSPRALAMVPEGKPSNMTDLINACLAGNRKVAAYPLHEYWTDIGTPDDLERARKFFAEMVNRND